MRNHLLLFISFLTFSSAGAQCLEREILWKRIIQIRDAYKQSPSEQLPELLGYLKNINLCPYKNDSVHCTLLRITGAKYYQLGDFINAIKYYKESVISKSPCG